MFGRKDRAETTIRKEDGLNMSKNKRQKGRIIGRNCYVVLMLLEEKEQR